MIIMGTSPDASFVYYLREGHFAHDDCAESATVQVSVRITGDDALTVESVELWSCEACNLCSDEPRNHTLHDSLSDALDRLPPPPPGEMDVDDLAAQMLIDMAQARTEAAAA